VRLDPGSPCRGEP